MAKNIDRFKEDLEKLILAGSQLQYAMQIDCHPVEMRAQIVDQLGKTKATAFIKMLPNFDLEYQSWYSEAIALVRQLLPDRLTDFVKHYEKPKARKDITFENYRIEDYLQGLQVTRSLSRDVVVNKSAAINQFQQQLAIVKAAASRFKSSLFELKQLVQADLLDSEIETAEELAKHKFYRAAGAIAGVVLEKHLAQVTTDRSLVITKKNPTIADFNECLKANGVIDIPQWRAIQHLADIRNICDHGREAEPTSEQVGDLVAGVKKVSKTVY